MLQWAIELSEYGIEYQPRLSMKGQVMADFIAVVPQQPIQGTDFGRTGWWILHVDGASQSFGSGVGLLLKSPTSEQLEQSIRLGFPTSNNEAEYKVILSGLSLAITLSAFNVRIYSDSQLIVRHIQKEYGAKDEGMSKYLMKVQDSLNRLDEWVVERIPWTTNMQADALAGIATSLPIREFILLPIYVQTAPSIAKSPICNTIKESQ